MKKIKQVLSLAKSLGKEYALKDNYILIKVSSQLPPYTDLARGVSSLDHYEVRHPYSDSVIGAFTVWDSSRIPAIVKLGIFQNEHKTIGLIETLYEKIKELYPSVPEDFEKYMYSVWGGSPTDMAESGLHAHSMNRFHEVLSALKRSPLRKSFEGEEKGFEDHLDYHIYQNNEHLGSMNGKELNQMMPSRQHREDVSKDKGLVFHPTNVVSGDPAKFMKSNEEEDDKGFKDHLDYHIYQNNEHVGTMAGKELNAMMPSKSHREQTEKEKSFVFHASNTVTGNPASYMKKTEDMPSSKEWLVKLAGSDGYHPLVDIVDSKQPLHEGGGNVYSVRRPDGSVTHHHQDEIEDVKFADELSSSMPVHMRD
jgi:hypothetical protein